MNGPDCFIVILLIYSFDAGGISLACSSARSALTTRSNWSSNLVLSSSHPVKSAGMRDRTCSGAVNLTKAGRIELLN